MATLGWVPLPQTVFPITQGIAIARETLGYDA